MSSKDMTNCPYLPLPEVLSFIVDNRGKTVPTAESGIPLIATNCIKNMELYPVQERIRYVSETIYKTWFRAHPVPGDIIFVNKGAAGAVCMVPDPVRFCIAQDMMAFRVNESIINSKYLFAVLRSPQFQAQIKQFYVGTLIPHFKKRDLDKLLIPVPALPVQKFIGETYFALCRKIELNNHINNTLAELAQAIFKNLFVDFQPFQDSEFADSELGRIPKGWRVERFTKVVKVCGGGTPKTNVAAYWNGNIPFFTPKDCTSGYYVLDTEKHITPEGLKHCNSKLYPKDTVFVTARGTVGKVNMAVCEMAMNQSCYALKGHAGYSQYFVHQLTINLVDKLKHKASGAVFDAIVTRDFAAELVCIPPKELLDHYDLIIEPIYPLIRQNQKESKILASTRDTLLPKFISGQVKVPMEDSQ